MRSKERQRLESILATIVGVKLSLLCRFRNVLRRWSRRRNQNKSDEPGRPLRRQELSNFSSHGMAHQNISMQV